MKNHGNSLPEALIAVAILSVGMLAVMLLALRGNALIRADLEARQELRRAADAVELEQLRPRITAELHEQLRGQVGDEVTAP